MEGSSLLPLSQATCSSLGCDAHPSASKAKASPESRSRADDSPCLPAPIRENTLRGVPIPSALVVDLGFSFFRLPA